MAFINKLSSIRPDFQPEANFTDFVIDSDLLRDDPQIVFKKTYFETVKKINSVENYKNYGVIMEIIRTTNPKSKLGRLIKQTTAAATDFVEYLVFPIDKPSVSLDTYLQKPLDLYKAATLLRCIYEDVSTVIPVGSLVRLEYDNNLKDEATITKVFGELPPVLGESSQTSAADTYKSPPCVDTSKIKATADAVNGDQNVPLQNSQAPTPNMSTTPCSKIEIPVRNFSSISPDIQLSKYFTLADLIVTNQRVDNSPNEKQIERLKLLCTTLLDPIREIYGEFTINSAFRGRLLNARIRGATTSQHMDGDAADIKFNGLPNKEAVFDLFEKIKNDRTLPYNQLIFECDNINSYWFHIAQAREGGFPSRDVLSYGPWSDEGDPTIGTVKRRYLQYNRNNIRTGLASRGITDYFV